MTKSRVVVPGPRPDPRLHSRCSPEAPQRVVAPPEGHGTHGGSQHLQRVMACRPSPSLLQARCPPEEGVWGTKRQGISPTPEGRGQDGVGRRTPSTGAQGWLPSTFSAFGPSAPKRAES